MENEGQERKHLPTAKRLAELRKRGTVLRSKDMTGGMIFFVTISLIIFMADYFKQQIMNNFISAFSTIKELPNNPDALILVLKKILLANVEMLLPVFIFSLVAAIISPFLFGGWNFTLDAIQFKFEKINPLNNLQKMLSPKNTALEIMRSMFKCLVILGVLVCFLYNKRVEIFNLINFSLSQSAAESYSILQEFVMYLSISLIFIIAFDVIYHYFQFQHQAKMSAQELKDEYKDTEGNVEVKRKIRSAQIGILKQRLSVMVPKANVIITNPTHYAIALQYHDKKDRAPRVVAKGKDYVAQQIKYIAIANAIPIYEAPPLARAIYHTTKIGMEIHPGLYMAVAIVLSYVHQLKNYQRGVGQAPHFVTELEIPDEFIY